MRSQVDLLFRGSWLNTPFPNFPGSVIYASLHTRPRIILLSINQQLSHLIHNLIIHSDITRINLYLRQNTLYLLRFTLVIPVDSLSNLRQEGEARTEDRG